MAFETEFELRKPALLKFSLRFRSINLLVFFLSSHSTNQIKFHKKSKVFGMLIEGAFV